MVTETMVTAGGLALDEMAIQGFAAGFHGELFRPGDGGFDDARRVWNGMIDRTPALIARCAGVADVVAAVNFAREQQLLVAVRGGGHNVSGNAVCDRGLVIDLSRMRGIRVDPARRTARVEGGATWGDLDREAQAFGLATTGGIISTTGVGGLTLGGGVGWLVRKHGLACDNLLSVDVVTADGRLVTASDAEHADLFWGIRGGGGNFGVVTSLEFRLHPVGPVLGGMVLHPREAAPAVLRFYREFTQRAPEELTTYCGLLTAPDGVPVVALIACYSGSPEEGERVLRPLREFGSPVADLIGPMPYRQMQGLLDAGFPKGLRNYWKGNFLRELPDEAIDRIVARAAEMASPLSAVVLEYYGGAASRVDEGATAFPHRRAMYDLVIIAQWADPAEDERHAAWARETAAALEPYASGVYVNLLGTEGDERVRAAYGANYERLATLKARYDPANLFRMNQNIRPMA
jgi:FAD/FMN-containing dehydrogenase